MNWGKTFEQMKELAKLKEVKDNPQKAFWKCGQEYSIRWMADQLSQDNRNGVLVADEVGMGKTRVVMAAILAVLKNGGTVAAVVPPGLLYQWKKEWDDFISNLKEKKDYAPILLRSYHSLFDNTDLRFPLSENSGKWLLVSHQFGPPILQTKSNIRRFWLPILSAAIRQRKDKVHQGNKFWQALKNEGWSYDCLDENCSDCSERKRSICKSDLQIKRAAEFLANNRWGKFRNIDDIRNPNDAKDFYKSQDGLQMLGDLLGPIDLIVIDEAHKNRGENSKLETILKIIKKNPLIKHITMTATPMELDPEQWKDLFRRMGEPCPEKAINEFKTGRDNAKKNPDNSDNIKTLISASERFTASLRRFVTRRLRIKQDEMRKLLRLNNGDVENCAHPHRDASNPINICLAEVEDDWKPSIFALEALGKAAKGCNTDDKNLNDLLGILKIADSRYAAGQIKGEDEDKLDGAIKEYLSQIHNESNESPHKHILGKLQRIQYWQGKLKKVERDLSGHPRIQHVADAIEKTVWSDQEKKEKILVFGTFKKPLRALWDVLNRRAVLRFLDRKAEGDKKEPPIPAVSVCLKNLDSIWKEYERIKLKQDIGLKRTFSSKNDLRKAIVLGGKTYESLRNRLTNHIDNKFVQSLPGDAVITSVKKKVAELLRARLINELICRGETMDNLKPSDLKNKALNVWSEYLESYFDKEEDGIENLKAKTKWKKPNYFVGSKERLAELKELDRFADNVGKIELNALVDNEIDDISGRLGFFARLLDGDVKMETRRVLQAQFNDKYSFPLVLIAQSQVGREGLNLHKACRTVIQFHSEWNPGVVEQQIGRVDRIESFWEELARKHNEKHPKESVLAVGFPKIRIRPVVFEGTYDDFQYKVSKQRRETLNAHLFGELLNEEALINMPKDGEWKELRDKLKEAAPDFSPLK